MMIQEQLYIPQLCDSEAAQITIHLSHYISYCGICDCAINLHYLNWSERLSVLQFLINQSLFWIGSFTHNTEYWHLHDIACTQVYSAFSSEKTKEEGKILDRNSHKKGKKLYPINKQQVLFFSVYEVSTKMQSTHSVFNI